MARLDIHKLCFSLFFISELAVLKCYCQTTALTPVDPEVVEGSDITFVCTVSSAVNYVNWQLTEDTRTSYTTLMALYNGACAISPSTSILSDTTKYSYSCNSTVYQVTVKNVQRSHHNNAGSCSAPGQASGPTSTLNVLVPVSSVSITPSSPTKNVLENTVEEFTCQTTASRPDALVSWYKIESGVTSQINQNITSSTTNDDFSVTTSTLRFVPSRQQHGVQIFCKSENTVNTSPKQSDIRTLNVLYRAGNPVITEGNEYRVIENRQGQLSCTVNGGNPTPTLTWNCNVLSPIVSDLSNNGVITKILTWTAVRGSDTTCSCTSQQNGFSDRVVSVNVDVLRTTTLASTIRTPTTKKVLSTYEHIPSTSESTGKPENEVIQLLHAMHQEVTIKLDSCINATNRLAAAEEERNRVLKRLMNAIINVK